MDPSSSCLSRRSRKGSCPIVSICTVNWIWALFSCCVHGTDLHMSDVTKAQQVSSTQHSQNFGGLEKVVEALCSTSSMTRLATAIHTGEAIALPCKTLRMLDR